MNDNAQSNYNNNNSKFNHNNNKRNDYNSNVYSTSFPTTIEYSSNTYNVNQTQSACVKYSFSPDFLSSSTVDSLCSPH